MAEEYEDRSFDDPNFLTFDVSDPEFLILVFLLFINFLMFVMVLEIHQSIV